MDGGRRRAGSLGDDYEPKLGFAFGDGEGSLAAYAAGPVETAVPASPPEPPPRPFATAAKSRAGNAALPGLGGWLTAALFGFTLYAAQSAGMLAELQNGATRMVDETAVSAGLGLSGMTITGNANVSAEAVAAALALPSRISLAGIDTAAAARRLEGIGWVARARVHREWPTTLAITITEREPFAAWRDAADRWFAVDRAGVRLDTIGAGDYRALPRIAGEGAPVAAAGLVTALAAFPALAARLDLATREAGRFWRLRAGDAPELLIADATAGSALAEAQHLGVLDPALGRDVARIDLRIPGATVLRLREATPAAAAAFVARHVGAETTAALGPSP